MQMSKKTYPRAPLQRCSTVSGYSLHRTTTLPSNTKLSNVLHSSPRTSKTEASTHRSTKPRPQAVPEWEAVFSPNPMRIMSGKIAWYTYVVRFYLYFTYIERAKVTYTVYTGMGTKIYSWKLLTTYGSFVCSPSLLAGCECGKKGVFIASWLGCARSVALLHQIK